MTVTSWFVFGELVGYAEAARSRWLRQCHRLPRHHVSAWDSAAATVAISRDAELFVRVTQKESFNTLSEAIIKRPASGQAMTASRCQAFTPAICDRE